ncbi:MAG: PilZ domain-containing protein [Gammaproteobacteria bacterium]|nr:PilZ domain-containing protein [Gammaproteobacteria bacterium]MDE2250188.1 PilZ domain-containing protein [Gammaproteobacteria bacterium]
MQIGRSEHRGAMTVAATVHSAGTPLVVEDVWIHNISNRGARIHCHRTWHPHEQLVLTSSLGDLRTEATVVYCERLSADECAVGLKFARPLAAGTMIFGIP